MRMLKKAKKFELYTRFNLSTLSLFIRFFLLIDFPTIFCSKTYFSCHNPSTFPSSFILSINNSHFNFFIFDDTHFFHFHIKIFSVGPSTSSSTHPPPFDSPVPSPSFARLSVRQDESSVPNSKEKKREQTLSNM